MEELGCFAGSIPLGVALLTDRPKNSTDVYFLLVLNERALKTVRYLFPCSIVEISILLKRLRDIKFVRSQQPDIISIMFRSLLWFYKNECKAHSNCIHDPTFRHSSLVCENTRLECR